MGHAIISNDKESKKIPLKIMIVENEICLTHLYYFILDKHLSPLTCSIFYDPSSGKDAIKALKEGHRPDFAILDIRLNGVNGIDVFKELRKVSQVPVIFLTAMSDKDEEFQEACFAVGKENVIRKDQIKFFNDILPKIPNVKEYLRCMVGNCLKGDGHACQMHQAIK